MSDFRKKLLRSLSSKPVIAALLAGIAIVGIGCPPFDGTGRTTRGLSSPGSLAGDVVVLSAGNNSISVFSMDREGRVSPSPVRTIGASVLESNNTGLRSPFALALDPAGNPFVANQGDNANEPSVTMHQSGDNGNAAPTRNIPGTAAGLVKPTGITFLKGADSILVANWVDPPAPDRLSGIIEFSKIPGEDSPVGSIAGSATTITAPGGVALDLTGNVYVSDPGTDRILVFMNRRSRTAWTGAPSRIIAGPRTALHRPSGVALDGQGNLYVANMGSNSITIYAAGATGNADPVRSIGGPGALRTRLNLPTSLAVDKGGRIFVTQGNGFLIFGAGDNGNVPPQSTVEHERMNLTTGIAIRQD